MKHKSWQGNKGELVWFCNITFVWHLTLAIGMEHTTEPLPSKACYYHRTI